MPPLACWRDRRCRDRLAGTARILRAGVAMDEEAGQLHVQLLADVFADFDQVGAALADCGSCRCLSAAIPAARPDGRRAGAAACPVPDCQVLFDRGQVHVDCFFEQKALLACERFTGLAEADPALGSQFGRQRGDPQVLLGKRRILPHQLRLLRFEHGLHLHKYGWVDVAESNWLSRSMAQ